jgi:pyridoxal phosphate enzyme (YggS family)
MSIASNIAAIRERIATAAQRAGRNPDEITLVAVSKTFPAEFIIEAYDAGQRVFGENRVQEFADKATAIESLRDAQFHLIGHLQSNKSSKAAELFHAIDSVDSLRLARRLNDAAENLGKTLDVLIEINVGGEEQKSGVAPGSRELDELLQAASSLDRLHFRGLMTVPPYAEDPEGARTYFRMLHQLREDLSQRSLPAVGLDVLSMGMSHDFEVAIEEGATQVRVGTAIFGERKKPA